MNLYQHLKASQTSPPKESEIVKTSQTSLARARLKGNLQLSSYKSDIRDEYGQPKGVNSLPRAQVTFGTGSNLVQEAQIIAWKNANLPDLPDAQNNCAACGVFIPVYDTGWVILGDGALIHYSGKHGKTCWDAWMSKRRKEAETNLGVTTL